MMTTEEPDYFGFYSLELAGFSGIGHSPVWLLELNGALHAYGFTEQELAEWLRERGYDLALYDADRRKLYFKEAPWRKRANVLAIARTAREEIAARVK